ncbi:poly polymerase and DNA-ligase Zn-finger region-domain-containing protein [Bombardia bombarda]|uniref:Poly polymerase and DNA-ligase Zn-finger region-domain-containing protein n=1 Tax=Bombardia bombarda TaxID=252184 RepID=A0AA39W530_9PEZI|nr:poly polymerase and DNA-ligase Zn-finger region-domain-containing protein [Bombardia bombarda]
MSYRIEVCPNNRAGCKDKNCKDAAVKIKKGELRLGTWVEIQEHGSWAWRHWGCVSGEQIQNMQNKIGKGSNGEYRWDALDGWEELEDAPAVQERIKRVINQGFIDPEDFNGVSGFRYASRPGIPLTHIFDK